MPVVHVIPVERGMQRDEVIGRVQGGWTLLGRQAIQIGIGVATPQNPEGGKVVDADVWIMNEPTIPMGMVAGLLLETAEEYASGDAMASVDLLECLCRDLFGMDLPALREAYLATTQGGHTDAQGQHPSGD